MSNTFTRDPEPLVQYGGDGSRTSFPFPFPVLASDDLLVFVNQAAATGFSISGIGDPNGGEIGFVTRRRPAPRSPCCAVPKAFARARSSTAGRSGLRRSTPSSTGSCC